jgi:hypothetical protein
MRLIKLVGLAAIVIAATTAVLGASSASANVVKTVFCKVNQNLCSSANLWGTDATLKTLSTLTEILGTVNVKCHMKETILFEISDSDRILSTVILHDLTNCSGCTTVTTTTLPHGSLFPTTTGNGKFETTSLMAILLKGCPLGLECTVLMEKVTMSFTGGTIGGTAQMEVNEAPTVNDGAFCGTGKWDAGPGESEPSVVTEVNGSTSGGIYISKESHA